MRRRRIRIWLASCGLALGLILTAALGFAAARDASCRRECRGNLSIIGLGLHNFADVHGHFPSATVANEELAPERRLSWIVEILHFLEGGGLWLVDRAKGWDEGANRVIKRRAKESDEMNFVEGRGRFRLFHCPAHGTDFDARGRELTSYVGIAGLGPDAASLAAGHPRAGVFGFDRPTPPSAITDGLGTTMAIAETAEANGPWKAGGPATVRGLDPARRPYIGPGRPFGGIHRDGMMVVFADGSVRFVRSTIAPSVLEALSTIAGGERLPIGWDR